MNNFFNYIDFDFLILLLLFFLLTLIQVKPHKGQFSMEWLVAIAESFHCSWKCFKRLYLIYLEKLKNLKKKNKSKKLNLRWSILFMQSIKDFNTILFLF